MISDSAQITLNLFRGVIINLSVSPFILNPNPQPTHLKAKAFLTFAVREKLVLLLENTAGAIINPSSQSSKSQQVERRQNPTFSTF